MAEEDMKTPDAAPPAEHPFRRGLLLGFLLGFGPQVLVGLFLVLGTRQRGDMPGLDQLVWMLMADVGAFAVGLIGLTTGTLLRPKGRRGAFIGGGAVGLGTAMLLALPTCLGIGTIVPK